MSKIPLTIGSTHCFWFNLSIQQVIVTLMNISKHEKQMLIQELAELKQEHRELDITINEMIDKVESNQLKIKRLKKQKLKLKDAISRLESNLIPDLHA